MKYPTDFKRPLANRLPDDIVKNIVSYLLQAEDTEVKFIDNGWRTVDGVGGYGDYERVVKFKKDFDFRIEGIAIHKEIDDIENDWRDEMTVKMGHFRQYEKLYPAMNFHKIYTYKTNKIGREKKINDFYDAVRKVHLFLNKVINYRAMNKIATVYKLEQKGDKLEDVKFEARSAFNKVGQDIRQQAYEYEKSGKIEDLMKCVEIRTGYEEKNEKMTNAIRRHEYNTLILKRAKKGKNQLPLWRPLMLMDGGNAGFSLAVMKKDGTF